MLAKISNESEWHKQIVEVEFAINNAKNRSVNDTPSRLLFDMNQQVTDKLAVICETHEERNIDEKRY